MAHQCPDCGLTCHCGGDIDDLLLDGDEYVEGCSHCDDCYDEDGFLKEEYDDEDDED